MSGDAFKGTSGGSGGKVAGGATWKAGPLALELGPASVWFADAAASRSFLSAGTPGLTQGPAAACITPIRTAKSKEHITMSTGSVPRTDGTAKLQGES